MIIHYRVLILLSALVLSACQSVPKEALLDPEPMSSQYRCGLMTAQLKVEGKGAELELGDRTIAMTAVVAESGVRYQSQETESEFWQQGPLARLVVNGVSWPECTIAGSVPFFLDARGNEPFWHLKLEEDRAVLSRLGFNQEQEGLIVERNFEGRTEDALLHFGSDQEQLTVEASLCQDSMTGMPYPYRVRLSHEGQILQGCGGKPYDLLQGPQWRVTSLQEQEIPENIELSMFFSEDRRLSGRSACNRYFGAVRLSGEGLDIGNLATTRMGCAREVMEWEQSFLAVLAQVSRFSLTEDQQLVLYIGDTPALLADF